MSVKKKLSTKLKYYPILGSNKKIILDILIAGLFAFNSYNVINESDKFKLVILFAELD